MDRRGFYRELFKYLTDHGNFYSPQSKWRVYTHIQKLIRKYDKEDKP